MAIIAIGSCSFVAQLVEQKEPLKLKHANNNRRTMVVILKEVYTPNVDHSTSNLRGFNVSFS